MNIDIVNIIAASALIVPTAATVVLWAANKAKSKAIKRLESCKANLSELLAEEKAKAGEELEDVHQSYAAECQQLTSRINELQGILMGNTLEPLADIADADLAHVVKKELTKRVKLERQASMPWGNTAHKLATTVGGACFRVVDHCKRGNGEFQAYGPYHDPKAVDATMAPAGK